MSAKEKSTYSPPYDLTLFEFVDKCCFRDWSYRGHFVNVVDFLETVRFLYKGIIIKHNKTEPTYTKTSLFLCEKRRFFMARTEKGGNIFKLAGPRGLVFFHLIKKEVSKWPMKK